MFGLFSIAKDASASLSGTSEKYIASRFVQEGIRLRILWRAYLPAIASSLALGIFLGLSGIPFPRSHRFSPCTDSLGIPESHRRAAHLLPPNNLLRLLCWPKVVFLLWLVWRTLPRLDCMRSSAWL